MIWRLWLKNGFTLQLFAFPLQCHNTGVPLEQRVQFRNECFAHRRTCFLADHYCAQAFPERN